MVQRKVPSKLGIHLDHVKSEKLLGSLGPSSPRHQDLKKKKMKKVRLIKRSDFESLRPSPAFRREVPQPGKPPPLEVAATPQKQSPLRKSDASPNYMKSTSSSEARKERSLVSFRSFQDSVDSKSPKKISKNSKIGSASNHNPAKTLSRTSSLKLVRTLTKSPSFKPVRASAKKCSQAVLCENLNAQRATCSSTLKDAKFPSYLALCPGATETEGTSVIKVCPYTYCSLNGHRHAPLPPLKCFLSARRRMLKTQKSIKMGCLSPRRVKPSSDEISKITGQITPDEKPTISRLDSNCPAISPHIQEDHMDFFIEIYARDVEGEAKPTDGRKHGDDQEKTTLDVNDFMPSVGSRNEMLVEYDDQQVEESLSDEAPHAEVNFEDSINENGDFGSMNMDDTKFLKEVQSVKMAEEKHSPWSTQEEGTTDGLRNKGKFEAESLTSIELDETNFGTPDMEWEEGQYSSLSLDDESCNLAQTSNSYEFEIGSSITDEDHALQDGPIFKSDNNIGIYNEIPEAEGVEALFDQEDARSPAGCSDNCSDSEASSLQMLDNKCNAILFLNYDAVEESPAKEKNEDVDSDDLVATTISLAQVDEPIEEPQEGQEEEIEDLATDSTSGITEFQHEDVATESTGNSEGEIYYQANESQQDNEATVLLGSQQFDSCSHTSGELHRDETQEDYTSSDNTSEIYQLNAVNEWEFVESLLPNTKEPEMYQNLDQDLPPADAGDEIDKPANDASLIEVPILSFFQDSSGADQNMTKEQNKETQPASLQIESKPDQPSLEGAAAENQVDMLDNQSQIKSVEDQHHSEEDSCDLQNFKVLNSTGSEEPTPSALNKVSVSENNNGDVMEMETEQSTTSGPEENIPSSKDATSRKAKSAFSYGGSHSNQGLPKSTYTLNITRGKRPVEETDEMRKFNPREPNYLPVEPDPGAEKVDLKHQMMDERKNTEEWMLDYALQQAVTRLAPARKRKVALLVEAFEKVMPIPKYEPHLRHTSAGFDSPRAIQACS